MPIDTILKQFKEKFVINDMIIPLQDSNKMQDWLKTSLLSLEKEILREVDTVLEKWTGKHKESGEIERSLFGDTIFARKDLIMNDINEALAKLHKEKKA